MSGRRARAARAAAVESSGGARSPWLARAPLLAAALAFVVHLPSLAGGFLYDDIHQIVEDPAIRDLRSLATLLRSEPARPLLSLNWALNYAVAGLTPWPWHLVNVVIHAANGALVASLLLWMARRSGREEPTALLGACLFAASPMAAETVGYVSSRSTALAALFGLASLRLAVDALAGGSPRRLAAAFGFFLLALGTKEEAAAVPLVLLLLDYFFIARQRPFEMRGRVPIHALFLALPVLGLAARRVATGVWLPPPALEPRRFLATQAAVFPLYLARALVPLDPAFYRGHPPSPWPPDNPTLAGWCVTGAILAVAVVGRRRWPEWSFAVACLAAGLLPSSSIVALKEMVVDHRAYLGSAGIAFALASALWRPGRTRLAVVLVVLLAARAAHYEWILADPVRVWEDAVRRAPRSVEAWLALGDAYGSRRDARGAENALRTATALDPGDPRGWANLGALYVEQGRLDGAADAMRRAVRLSPGDARIRDNLGLILQGLGREEEAIAEYEAALRGEPPLAQPRIALAEIFHRRGQDDRARGLLEEALKLPLDAEDARRAWVLYPELKPSGAP